MKRAFVPLMAVLLFVACSESSDVSSPAGEAAATPENAVVTTGHGLLPAFALPGERKVPGENADDGDDWRAAYPEWYAITVPPAVAGYRHMVEWEPMAFNIIAYPDYLAQEAEVRQTMIDIAVNTLDYADLHVVYNSENMRTDFIDRLRTVGINNAFIDEHVTFHNYAHDSVWLIDFGPLPLVDPTAGSVAFLDWRYYHDRYNDDGIPTQLGDDLGISTYRQSYDVEGGNFQGDGQGTCFTSQRAFAYGGLQADLEAGWSDYAACDELVVMRDIHSDGTGHIDMFFKLISPTDAIIGEFTAAQDAQAAADMDWNAELLEARGITVHRMPMPNSYDDPLYGATPRTYLNSTLIDGANGKVNLWPVYTVDQDIQAAAEAVWETALPDWTHVGINCDAISALSGAIHCVTRTVPDQAMTPWVANGVCTDNVCAPSEGGFSGECIDSDDCWGPAWVCPTNDCVPCETVADCDDNNPCTIDSCDVGCSWTPVACGDGMVCMGGECVEGGDMTCAAPFALECGAVINGDTTDGESNILTYSPCQTWQYEDADRVYSFGPVADASTVDLTLSGLIADLDLFVLSTCADDSCVGSSAEFDQADENVSFQAVPGQTYYIVVDGSGAVGPYALSLECGEPCIPDCS